MSEPWGHIDGARCDWCGVRYAHHGWLRWQWHALRWWHHVRRAWTIMASDDAAQAARLILEEHQLVSRIGVCACGWDEAGQTHAQHLLHQLQMAGLDVVWR